MKEKSKVIDWQSNFCCTYPTIFVSGLHPGCQAALGAGVHSRLACGQPFVTQELQVFSQSETSTSEWPKQSNQPCCQSTASVGGISFSPQPQGNGDANSSFFGRSGVAEGYGMSLVVEVMEVVKGGAVCEK